ncbi:hypothetical protein SARC_05439 [Sphaeroforma arctica JP610]|uniref:Uncharacterized protein n=1 Tax=Sphaeroforma arctica JP610 TaxID=667725 RepID=A0A0L0FZK3_9EUKA|nr:hypothetical protein SARC_05439 [Sphaeroforma arctica JP610]KNC82267.1 hypothetical protein SARC_05439 [Sphaeroforma arctica JP610]|eukprot:XP_014156169.1 hypothetical protein SARC_05439 [Sphaeroforma arctica JP610]
MLNEVPAARITGTSSYTADDVLRIATDAADATAKLLERKRECNNMVDVILEGYEQKRQYLITEIGIETDEDAGFVANR